VFKQGEYIRIDVDGDYVENDDDAFRLIARHLTSPLLRRICLLFTWLYIGKRFKNAQFKNMEFLEIVKCFVFLYSIGITGSSDQ
jgi:hypothetical protein